MSTGKEILLRKERKEMPAGFSILNLQERICILKIGLGLENRCHLGFDFYRTVVVKYILLLTTELLLIDHCI